MKSRISACNVVHTRYTPVRHSFDYPVSYYVFDLADLDTTLKNNVRRFWFNSCRRFSLFRANCLFRHDRSLYIVPLWLFGYNIARPISLYDEDYIVSKQSPEPLRKQIRPYDSIKDKLLNYLRLYSTIDTTKITRIELLTNPRYFGYSFNPVSFYFCYCDSDAAEKVFCFVAEVNNTFGERHIYYLDETHMSSDVRLNGTKLGKYDFCGKYEFKFADPRKHIQVNINQLGDDDSKVMSTFLIGVDSSVKPMSDKNIALMILKFPVAALITLPRISWQAMKLHYKKRLPVYSKPNPSSDSTIGLVGPSENQFIAQSLMVDCFQKIVDEFNKRNPSELVQIDMTLPDSSKRSFGSIKNATSIKLIVKNYEFFVNLLDLGYTGLLRSFTESDFDSPHLQLLFAVLLSTDKQHISLSKFRATPDESPSFIQDGIIEQNTSHHIELSSVVDLDEVSEEQVTEWSAKFAREDKILVISTDTGGFARSLAIQSQALVSICLPEARRAIAAQRSGVSSIHTLADLAAGKLSGLPFTHILDALAQLVARNGTRLVFIVPTVSNETTLLSASLKQTRSPGLSYKINKAKENILVGLLDKITSYVMNPFTGSERLQRHIRAYQLQSSFGLNTENKASSIEDYFRGKGYVVTASQKDAPRAYNANIIDWWSEQGRLLARTRQLPCTIEEIRLVYIASHIRDVRRIMGTERMIEVQISK